LVNTDVETAFASEVVINTFGASNVSKQEHALAESEDFVFM
jgi:hypothetical protein